jgi:hypothetical protein
MRTLRRYNAGPKVITKSIKQKNAPGKTGRVFLYSDT